MCLRRFSIFLICIGLHFPALSSAAQRIIITEQNSAQIIFIGGKLNLACYAERGLLGILRSKQAQVGAAFRVIKPRQRILRLKKSLGLLKSASRAATRQAKLIKTEIREIKSAARFCAAQSSSLSSSFASSLSSSASSASSHSTAFTFSNMGINVDGNEDWSTTRTWINVRNVMRQWGLPDQPWIENPSLTLTSNGYPLQDAGAISSFLNYPNGTYQMRYTGTASVTVSGAGHLQNVVKNGDVTSAQVVVQITTPGTPLTIKVSNIDPNHPMQDFRLMLPGHATDTTEIFAPEFLERLSAFKTIRFMDWGSTNNSPLVNWLDRRTADNFIQTGSYGDKGVAFEYMIALGNQLQKDIWVSVPDQASDDFVRQMARLFRDNLNPSLHIYLEYSNELWNYGFPQAQRIYDAAQNNPELTGLTYERAAQQIAFRLKEIADIWRQEFGAGFQRIRPVLAGQAANYWWAQTGLEFIQTKYGPPQNYFYGLAIGTYVDFDNALDNASLTLDGLFAAMNNYIDTYIVNWITNNARLAESYGLPLLGYEGGQGLSSSDDVNTALKIQAQSDPRMADIYRRLIGLWQAQGGDLFNHYSFACRYSKWGSWGLLTSIDQTHSVKWDVVMEIMNQSGG